MKIVYFILFLPAIFFGQVKLDAVKTLIAASEFNKAETSLHQFLASNPNNMEAVELLGDVYGHQKKWDHAILNYKKLVDYQPNQANYHYKYGGALGMKALSVNKLKALSIIDDVKAAFLKAAELDKNHIDTRWALVELYMKLPGILGGSKSKAIEFANQLEKLSVVDGYLAKGYIYENDNEPEIAENYYKKAITVGGSMTCYDKLTQFYIGQKQHEKAIENLRAAYKVHKSKAVLNQIQELEKNL